MTVRELIDQLNAIPESLKDLPIAVDCKLKQRTTYNPNYVHMGWDECDRQSIIID